MTRPPRMWGLFVAGLWFGIYSFITLFSLSGAIVPIIMGVLAFIIAVLLLFGSD